MKTQELTQKELLHVNGGSTGDGSVSYGTGISIGTDSLLTLTSESRNGNSYRKYELSIGNDISLNLFGLGNSQQG